MNVLDLLLVWVHVIAASFWVGGMLFLSLVAVPLLKQGGDPGATQRVFVSLARRFRTLAWSALAMLVLSGSFLLARLVDFSSSPLTWPPVILVKLCLVVGLVLLALIHDRLIGPKIPILKSKNPDALSRSEKRLLRLSPLIGRLTMLLGLAVLLAAVMMVRM